MRTPDEYEERPPTEDTINRSTSRKSLTGDNVLPLPAYAKPEGNWDAISCIFGSAAFPPGGWLVYEVGVEVEARGEGVHSISLWDLAPCCRPWQSPRTWVFMAQGKVWRYGDGLCLCWVGFIIWRARERQDRWGTERVGQGRVTLVISSYSRSTVLP